MKKSILLALILTSVLLSGCGSMIAKMGTSSYPTSTYNVLNITESDINEYYSLLEKAKGKVVKDEKGSYFYTEQSKDVFSRFALLNQDRSVLKSTLSSSIGLMEPVYSYNKNTEIEVDWSETERRYRFFTKEVGLKLLPLKTTRQYHELVLQSAGNIRAKLINPFYAVSASTSGELGLYNPEFYSVVLSGIIKNASYIISSGNTETFHTGQINRSQKNNAKVGTIGYSNAAKNINNFYNLSINFIPVSYFKNLNEGGSYRFYSGCQVNSKAAEIEGISLNNEATSIPYFSGIATAIKDKDQGEALSAKKYFYKSLSNVNHNRRLVERACKIGFKKMGLSGVIESRRL